MNGIVTSFTAFFISFITCIFIMPKGIQFLINKKRSQTVRLDGPETHLVKTGTPTMGGIFILISFLIGCIFFIFKNYTAVALIFITIAYSFIGFIDDYLKASKKSPDGLSAKSKLVLQFIVTTIFLFTLIANNLTTIIYIPFTTIEIDLGIFYYPLFYIAMLGTVNGVNLTDGIDGLASTVTSIICMFFIILALFLNMDIAFVLSSMVGALLGFLIYNSHPASVFMGDTGSLALGGLIGGTALILQQPFLILIVGFIYVLESVSVILQVYYYKKTKKRIFKMTPIHHHYEESGLSETKIVTLFSVITIILCALSLYGFYLGV
ncbi:MAG: phospho-N-acetylmuramoyl-pentapeptide-transferase [Lachnospirales bacterium]